MRHERRDGDGGRQQRRGDGAVTHRLLRHVVAGIEPDQGVGFVERNADRIAAASDEVDFRSEEFAQHGDAAIGRRQPVLAVQRDLALTRLRFVVAGKLPMFGGRQFAPRFAAEQRAAPVARVGEGTMRPVGSASSVTRRSVRPSLIVRTCCDLMPRGVYA